MPNSARCHFWLKPVPDLISLGGFSHEFPSVLFSLFPCAFVFGEMSDMRIFLESVAGADAPGRLDKAMNVLAKVEIMCPEDFVDTTKKRTSRAHPGSSIKKQQADGMQNPLRR